MRNVFLAALVALPLTAFTQVDLKYYMPENVAFKRDIPSPESVLGWQVGEWHVRHDQLLTYMYKVAKASDRITIAEYSRSEEERPLVLLTITSPANQQKINQIKEQHVKLCDPNTSGALDVRTMPAVVYQGFSVHGNEPSGANASLLLAYYLAAAEGAEINELLDNTVILLDPCYNPDGLARFAHWANMHKSKTLVSDPNNREHNEGWPSGRTNHYWFDLNRDWLPVQHPESQGRLKNFHQWKPNILTDHHEMGTNSTFFFQPGIPSRTNPNTPERNFELTRQIGEYHAKALDEIGSLYYSQESFDDFYYGKGSTYPDVNGCIGILFEQGSSRGHLQDSQNGKLSFPFTIRNQFTTALSTLAAAKDMRSDLLEYQRIFYQGAVAMASKDKTKGAVFDCYDKGRLHHLQELFLRHDIAVNRLTQNVSIGNHFYNKETAFVVSFEQPQYRLINAMLEKRTEFTDTLFYDVSAWTLPLAFHVQHDALDDKSMKNVIGEEIKETVFPEGEVIGGKSKYAYTFGWDEYYAPRAVHELLKNGTIVKVSQKNFQVETEAGAVSMPQGSILIQVRNGQGASTNTLYERMKKLSSRDGLTVYSLSTGLTARGIDLGSPNFRKLSTPKVLIIGGHGVSAYNAGEVWHLLDKRYQMPVSIVDASRIDNISLNKYSCIVMVDGSYGHLNKTAKERLKDWVAMGGVIVGMRGANNWLKQEGLANITFRKKDESDNEDTEREFYSDLEPNKGAHITGGAIVEAEVDLSHPLCWGYDKYKVPLFHKSNSVMELPKNRYASPFLYTQQPLLAGYIHDENLNQLKGGAAVVVSSAGKGRVISLNDNTNFRAFWYGTNRLFMNAIFFGNLIDGRSVEGKPPDKKK